MEPFARFAVADNQSLFWAEHGAKAAGRAGSCKLQTGKELAGRCVLLVQPDGSIKGILAFRLSVGDFCGGVRGGMKEGAEEGTAGHCLRRWGRILHMNQFDGFFACFLQSLIAGGDFLRQPILYGRLALRAAAGVHGQRLLFRQCPKQTAVQGSQTGHGLWGNLPAHKNLRGELLRCGKAAVIVRIAGDGPRGTDRGAKTAVITFFAVDFPVMDCSLGTDFLTAVAGDVGIVKQAAVQVDIAPGHGFSPFLKIVSFIIPPVGRI